MNKYLKLADDENLKRNEDAKSQPQLPLWFGPRFGKRSQQYPDDILPPEILEIFDKIEKSPELQKLIAERFQIDDLENLLNVFPKIQERSRPFTPRYGRDASETLNSRPYPPRFGRSMSELPPYLPRLGK